ncbi:Long-chain-fatty-acid--CoA ligase LcfB [Dirofilaria immitis]|nr:Long-chain-fatty-acid--CoA ligase LcfB [Dirofilaria immitis]
MSTAQNNITYHMGLEASGCHAAQTALILSDSYRLNYGNLSKLVGSMVALLHTTFGLCRGDRVLSRVEKSVDSLVLYLATIRLGAIYVPLCPAYTMTETIYFVEVSSVFILDSDPHLFVSCNIKQDEIFANKIEHIIDSTALFKESRQMKPDYGVECLNPNDIACICYTSGTTGSPKGAMISHGGLMWNAETLIDMWKFSQKDVPKFDVNDAFHWLPQCTVMMGVPTYYSRLMQRSNFDKNLTKNIRLFISGSAPLSTVLWEDFKQRTGHEILERYGMTEAAVITTNLYNDRRKGSVGKVLPGGNIRTTENDLVQIRLPSLFLGYWKNEKITQKVFSEDGFFNTGDIGKIDDDGFLWIQGRAKDLIISGGLNVYPKEVEDAVDSLPHVLESAVIGIPHHDLGEAVLAVYVPQSGSHAFLHESEAIRILHTKLANYKVPKRFLCLDQLPRNAMGKILSRTDCCFSHQGAYCKQRSGKHATASFFHHYKSLYRTNTRSMKEYFTVSQTFVVGGSDISIAPSADTKGQKHNISSRRKLKVKRNEDKLAGGHRSFACASDGDEQQPSIAIQQPYYHYRCCGVVATAVAAAAAAAVLIATI